MLPKNALHVKVEPSKHRSGSRTLLCYFNDPSPPRVPVCCVTTCLSLKLLAAGAEAVTLYKLPRGSVARGPHMTQSRCSALRVASMYDLKRLEPPSKDCGDFLHTQILTSPGPTPPPPGSHLTSGRLEMVFPVSYFPETLRVPLWRPLVMFYCRSRVFLCMLR